MKQFQMLRYIKKWRFLIAAIMVIGGVCFYYYALERQTYTARVMIRYTNEGASEGLAPDGSMRDVSDIFSARVINGVMSDLGYTGSIEGIRSSCDVEEIISEEEQIRKAAILDLGQEYVYYPTDYYISYTAGASSSPEFARRVVSSILDNYFRSYKDKYIGDAVLPNNASNLIGSSYDYIEQIQLLRGSITDIMGFLTIANRNHSGYRSSRTGYSFNDLYAIYEYIYDNTLPYLYSEVIDGALTKDVNILKSKYEQSILTYTRKYASAEKQLGYLDRVIEEYASKLSQSISAGDSDDEAQEASKTILQSVYDWNRSDADQTLTYDQLIKRRINYQLEMANFDISRKGDEDMLRVFEGALNTTSEKMEQQIANLILELGRIYETLSVTYDEFNEYRVAQNIAVLSNINVYTGLNIKLYLALTIIVFMVFGCVGAIVLGRAEDIVQYVVYNDSKTGLPNRARCDQEIAKYEGALLPDNFCCVIVSLDNLRTWTDRSGYAVGNAMLRQLSLMLKEVTNRLGFLGYNDAGQYLCLFDDCTRQRAESMRKSLLDMVGRYNKEQNAYEMNVTVAIACSTDEEEYSIKALIRLAYKRLREKA